MKGNTRPHPMPSETLDANNRTQTFPKGLQEAPPAMGTRSKCVSRMHQPTQVQFKKCVRPELAASVCHKGTKKRIRRLTRRMKRIENEVHQDLAVMDAESGKTTNYRQLMKSPKYKKEWSKSPENEFGHLADIF